MLYTDRYIVKPATLVGIDFEIQDVCNSMDPPVNLPNFCITATAQVTAMLSSRIQSSVTLLGATGLSGNHTSAVFNRGQGLASSTRFRLEQIVIDNPLTPLLPSPIVIWANYYALFLFYREISNRKILDRYAEKAERYEKESQDRWIWLQQNGMPVIIIPFPCPAGELWPYPGTFTGADIAQAASASATGGNLDFAVAWVDITQYNATTQARGNAESAPSPSVNVMVATGNVATVSIANLSPPDGTPMAGSPLFGPLPTVAATHWQLLAGPTGGPLRVQNTLPIPIATKTAIARPDPTGANLPPASQGQLAFTNALMYSGRIQW